MEYILMGLALMAIGLFSLICALKEAKWFFNNYKAKRFVDAFGIKFAKGFYIVLGILFIGLGIVPVVMFFS